MDRKGWHLWLKRNWTLSVYLVAGYLLAINQLVRWMRNRKPFDLKGPLFIWNLGLALFSTVATIRLMPELWRILNSPDGYQMSICDGRTFHSPVVLYWGSLFAFSKVAEFGDTLFILLRKRRLTFLHVFHHSTVLIGCWNMEEQGVPTARWFATINAFIHSIMYTYYALHVLRWFKIPKWVSMSITAMQIVQMVGGLVVNWQAYKIKAQGGHCDQSDGIIKLAIILCGSYLALFVWFFLNAYLWKGKESRKPKQV